MTNPGEATEWNTIFELLSLDRIVPFYEEMGLQLPDKHRFAEFLRSRLQQAWETCGPDLVPDMKFVEQVLKALEELFGKDTAAHFHDWATTVFYWAPSDQAQWSIWDEILPRRSHHLPPDLPAERWLAVAEFQQAKNVDDLTQKTETLKQTKPSEWDAEVYSRNHYQDRDDGQDFAGESIDPLSPIISTIKMNRLQLAWPKLWSHFTEEEKDLFWSYGKEKVKEWEVEETVPGGLPHPNDLRRQIPAKR